MSTQRPASDPSDSLVKRIVDGVSVVHGTQPFHPAEPLYHAVDPDALQRLVEDPSTTDLEITFEYQACRVTVDGDGAVTVSPVQKEHTDLE
ncbi:hypothetical protein G6M89_09865 [Natronolimnobius sp. AArcel1]|uniref:HalOD1 output domain-containing protein n=1 Tax=Natronolimnobius sp. AArcel1 TaxID=1679093 RepID=UPI0013EC92A4|nr:HalOD1 output domain-containing protein [Natronolimnobius sp. AArcel1]NGM69309.1 hypothetical protein [Natronolimnobius sp. AArcel1]